MKRATAAIFFVVFLISTAHAAGGAVAAPSAYPVTVAETGSAFGSWVMIAIIFLLTLWLIWQIFFLHEEAIRPYMHRDPIQPEDDISAILFAAAALFEKTLTTYCKGDLRPLNGLVDVGIIREAKFRRAKDIDAPLSTTILSQHCSIDSAEEHIVSVIHRAVVRNTYDDGRQAEEAINEKRTYTLEGAGVFLIGISPL